MTGENVIEQASVHRTDAVAAWAAAFCAAQTEMPTIPKSKTAKIRTKTGSDYSYTYADLNVIVEQVRPVLAKHGLGYAQDTQSDNGRVAVSTRIYHRDGHVETFGPLLLPGGSTPQEAGSAITYARRYALTAALGIAADEDDDAQAVSREEMSKAHGVSISVPHDPKVTLQNTPHEHDFRCPSCGSMVYDKRLTKTGKQPAFKCSNQTCTGYKNAPWVSWEPTFFDAPDVGAEGASEVSVVVGGAGEVTTGHNGQPLGIIEANLKSQWVTWPQVSKVAHMVDANSAPATQAALKDCPEALLVEIVKQLGLN